MRGLLWSSRAVSRGKTGCNPRRFLARHTLVVPRQYLRDVRELDDTPGAPLMASVARVARAVAVAFPSLLWVVILSISTFAHAADSASLEGQKIAYLIASVETLQGAQFIRNGTAYDAKTAADHLRLKLRMAGSRVVTAEDFIRLCASASSVSGIPYQIRFRDGRVVSSEAYLRQKLAEFKP